jgi:hypothetical protein
MWFYYLTLRSVATALSLHDNSQNCDCYVTDSGDFFLYHRFFDFRSLQDSRWHYDDEPLNVSNFQDDGKEPGQLGYLNSTAFAADWALDTWTGVVAPGHPVKRQNSKQNVYIRTFPK